MTKTATATTGPMGIKPGDIFVSSWGYDQTNVDFYRVVSVTAKSVRIQAVTTTVAESHTSQDQVEPGFEPVKGFWVKRDGGGEVYDPTAEAPVRTKRVQDHGGGPTLTMNSYANAYLWDGKPTYQTAPGWGH